MFSDKRVLQKIMRIISRHFAYQLDSRYVFVGIRKEHARNAMMVLAVYGMTTEEECIFCAKKTSSG